MTRVTAERIALHRRDIELWSSGGYIDVKVDDLFDLLADLDDADKRIAADDEQIATLKADWNGSIEERDKRIAAAEDHAGRVCWENADLKKRISELEAENARLKGGLLSGIPVYEPDDVMADLLNERQRADTLEAQLVERTKERDAALGTADDVYARWNESQAQLADAQKSRHELSVELAAVRNELAGKDARLSELEAAITDWEVLATNFRKQGEPAATVWRNGVQYPAIEDAIAAAKRALKPKDSQ